ncbi:MAG: RraA family protein [Granulosicoccus sp.]
MDDSDLFQLLRVDLFTAVIGDTMDKMGLQNQFLPPYLAPLSDKMVVAGRAMTVLEADFFSAVDTGSANPISAKPFGLMLEALDSLQPGEVYICTGSSPNYALWGGLMSIRAMQLGAAGSVLDGYVRDTREILELGYPIMARGRYAQDQAPRGKVIDFQVPIRIGGVHVNPGDIIFGDIDGVLVIPKAVESEVIRLSLEKVRGESAVRKALEKGMSTVDAFEKFGVM